MKAKNSYQTLGNLVPKIDPSAVLSSKVRYHCRVVNTKELMSMFRNDGGETPTDSLKGDWQPLSLSLDWKDKSREDLGI